MQFLNVLALAVVTAASAVVEAATPERSSWYYPFWRQSCTGCAAAGNVLPWCVKVPAQNIVCPVGGKATPILTCARVGYAAVAGKAASANALSASATVPASQLTCTDSTISSDCIDSLTTSVFPDSALPSSVTVDASQVSGDFPTTAFIAGSQVTGAIITATIAGSQVTGAINGTQVSTVPTANNLQCPSGAAAGSLVLPSCYAINATAIQGNIPGSQITGTIQSATFNGTVGSNACASIQSSCSLGSSVSYSTTAGAYSCDDSGTSISASVPIQCPTGSSYVPNPDLDAKVCPTGPITCSGSGLVARTFNTTTGVCTFECATGTISACGTAPTTFTTAILCA